MQTIALASPRVPTLDDDARALTRRARFIALSVAAGVLITVLWSFTLVDSTIGENVADGLLGQDAKGAAIGSAGGGIVFAFVSGLAGSFTACNVAGLSAIAPLTCQRGSRGDALRPLGWLALGACSVAGLYGAIGAAIGTSIPQLSEAMAGAMPVRLIQSMVIFGLIGAFMVCLGLAALGVIRDPLAGLYARRPRARVFVMGMLIGGFLIGRPYPLFHKMFAYAASTHDPAFGALAFILQSLGNIVVMSALFLGLAYAGGGAFPRWLAARPGRLARFTAGALLVAGTFTFCYWVVRMPAGFGIGWWPTMPWS